MKSTYIARLIYKSFPGGPAHVVERVVQAPDYLSPKWQFAHVEDLIRGWVQYQGASFRHVSVVGVRADTLDAYYLNHLKSRLERIQSLHPEEYTFAFLVEHGTPEVRH